MKKLKITIWIFVLANAAIAYAGLNLSIVFSHIFDRTVINGLDSTSYLSQNYIRHERWCMAVFTVPLLIAAVIISARKVVTTVSTILFGAVSILSISLQIFVAVMALGQPFIPVIIHFHG